jgi:DNA-3-methyladenine glycosylase
MTVAVSVADVGTAVGSSTAIKRRSPVPSPEVESIDFYARPVLEVAHDLIGCVIEHEGLAGVIVETEAYHESEPACHAFVGVTPRTRTLFGEPGLAYVYRSYGIHALLNAVCEPADVGAAVLIRALEPLVGIDEMRVRRARIHEEELCSGPGKLTQALGVELSENGTSLIDGPVVIRPKRGRQPPVVIGTRIGITKAVDLHWRFCAAGNPHVSKPRLGSSDPCVPSRASGAASVRRG